VPKKGSPFEGSGFMNKVELLDKLNRAYVMEEEMAGMLIDLCQPASLPIDLPEETRKYLGRILSIIKTDTLRHKKIVSEIRGNLP
jgi:hypothetical protein